MTRPYSEAFEQKMVRQLEEAVAPVSWSEKTTVRQLCLSHWLLEMRNLPLVGSSDHGSERAWTIEEKARILTEGSKLVAEQLSAYLA